MKLSARFWTRSVVASFLLTCAAAANAIPLLFTVTGGYQASWTMSSTPTPSQFGAGEYFYLFNVPGTFPGASGSLVELAFFSGPGGGGMEIYDPGLAEDLLSTDSVQLYSGTEANPVFSPGSFAMTDFNGSDATYTLTISNIAAPIPELSTVMSMLAGLGVMGTWLRRRRAIRT